MGFSILSVWNDNSSTSDASSTFTWTSSKVSGCSKTLKVTAKGKEVTYITSTISFGIDFYNNLDDDEYGGDFFGSATCIVDGNTWFSKGLSCSPGGYDGDTSDNYTLSGEKGKSYTVTFTVSVGVDYYGKCPEIEFSDSSNNIDMDAGSGDSITCPDKNKNYSKTFSTTITLNNDGNSYTAHITVNCSYYY